MIEGYGVDWKEEHTIYFRGNYAGLDVSVRGRLHEKWYFYVHITKLERDSDDGFGSEQTKVLMDTHLTDESKEQGMARAEGIVDLAIKSWGRK